MACYDNIILYIIVLHSMTVRSTDAAASSFTIGLVRYDTDWPKCSVFSNELCDLIFEICLNGDCISTGHANNTNHIDFNRTKITPNPVVFNESVSQFQTFASVSISVFDYNIWITRKLLMTLKTTINVSDLCKTEEFERTLTGQHNTRLQISVSVQGQCLSVPTTKQWWTTNSTNTSTQTTPINSTNSFLSTTRVILGNNSIRVNNGFVELKIDGRWGKVCYDTLLGGFFEYYTASLYLCKLAGYDRPRKIYHHRGTRKCNNESAVSEWLTCSDKINGCYSSPPGIYNCSSKLGLDCLDYPTTTPSSSTTPKKPVWCGGLKFRNYSLPVPRVRLVGGCVPWEGTVELYVNGQWGTIMSTEFDNNAARVICRMAGLSDSMAYAYRLSYYGSGTGNYLLNTVICTGNEHSILDCLSDGLYCSDNVYFHHREDAGVSCGDYALPPPTRYEPTLFVRRNWTQHTTTRSNGLMTNTRSNSLVTNTYYENYVHVNCQESNWYIRLYIRPLKQQFQDDFNARDVYLGQDSCTGYESGDYIVFNEEYNSCLTNKSTSNDAVIYTNTLVYALHDPDHRFIIRDYKFKIKVECDMSKREHGVNTIKHNHRQEDHTAAGTGHFSIHLNFYSDSNYQNVFNGFPPSYEVGDVVYVKVQTSMHDFDIKMRLSDCYTKPSEHASTIYTYYLIQNGCPVDRNTFVTSQSTHETRFHFQDFEYAGHPDSMFVHCNATFCKSNDYSSECEPQCKHSKRIGHHRSAVQNLNGPIEISDDETKILFTHKRDSAAKAYRLNSDSSNESSSKFRPLYVAGVIVVALAMICVLVALSIYFRRKKIRTTSRIV